MTAAPPVVAIIGGGIAGLAAAWELVTGSGDGPAAPEVHVFESGNRVGGKLAAGDFAGRSVDLAADAFLGRRPEATGLVGELGLDDQLVPIGATGASVWARDRLRPLPAGLNLGVPTRWWPLARSGILNPAQSVRAGLDLVAPHRASLSAADRSVADVVGPRLGRAVVERLVDPLIGGINAGGVDDLSAAATFPPLLAAADQSGSLMRRLGGAPGPVAVGPAAGGAADAPAFWSLSGSTASLAVQLAEILVRRGVSFHSGVAVESIRSVERAGASSKRRPWQLALADGGPPTPPGDRLFDGVVIAVPAGPAARLLAEEVPGAARLLGTIDYASVAVITLSVPAGSIPSPLRGTGFLVPRATTLDGRPTLVTGCTYLARKWPHLARPGDELLRASVGRLGDDRPAGMDDDALTRAVLGELGQLLGAPGLSGDALVTRWADAFPQYRVGHLDTVTAIEEAVDGPGGLSLAGAAYRGVGIPACIGSGRRAARRLLTWLADGRGPGS